MKFNNKNADLFFIYFQTHPYLDKVKRAVFLIRILILFLYLNKNSYFWLFIDRSSII